MQIDIRSRGFPLTDTLRSFCERRVRFALSRFAPRVSRVVVRLSDLNGPKGGVDKRCQLTVPVARGRTVSLESTDVELYAAIDRAADRAGTALSRELERTRSASHRAA